MVNSNIIYGAPGTGKTTKCTQIIKDCLDSGLTENDILYTTYRREAADDALSKIAREVGVKTSLLRKVVNTIHGKCFSLLCSNGLIQAEKRKNIIFNERKDILKFNLEYEYNLKPSGVTEDSISSGTADPFLRAYNHMRSIMTTPSEIYKSGLPVQYSISDFKRLCKDFEEWKKDNNKIEFSDMIDLVIKNELILNGKVQIYDEAQDMTPQMYTVAKVWSEGADRVFLAGDHLQTLYTYSGAEPKLFLDWGGNLEILPESKRLTKDIWAIAGDIIKKNTPYNAPQIKTRSETGNVKQINHTNLESYLLKCPHDAETFHLVRTNYLGGQVAEILSRCGVPFSGITRYSWTQSERNLYNAIQSIRIFRQLTKSEFCSLLDYYPARLTGAQSNPRDVADYKADIEARAGIPAMTKLNPNLIESIKTEDPLKLSNIKKGLTRLKIEGAFRRGLLRISANDVNMVKILTIHGSKGMQATNVFLHTGITRAIDQGMLTKKGRENEAFVWYVGVTRTYNNLVFVSYPGCQYQISGVWA
jgi:DNA helicase-2/ATP-dependent DNA helicase PcrA